MNSRVEILLATMNQDSLAIADEMHVQSPIVIANQCGSYGYIEDTKRSIRMISTATRGVGINRNLGLLHAREDILLFADDDMVYYDGYEQMILDAFAQLPGADMIFFSIDILKNGEKKGRHHKTGRVHLLNSLKFGGCEIAVRRPAAERAGLSFSTLFGGGARYSCGEDSLFIRECLRAGLVAYSHSSVIGLNVSKQSSWFQGYNEKYFYDKGAWTACAFPYGKAILKYYFAIRFKSFTKLRFIERLKLMNAGIRGFGSLTSYDDWRKVNE